MRVKVSCYALCVDVLYFEVKVNYKLNLNACHHFDTIYDVTCHLFITCAVLQVIFFLSLLMVSYACVFNVMNAWYNKQKYKVLCGFNRKL